MSKRKATDPVKTTGPAGRTVKHDGYEIEVTEAWEFRVEELKRTYASMAEARAAIDKTVKEDAKSKAAKLNLPVRDANGQAATIVGVHGGDGRLLTTPKLHSYASTFYPNVNWVMEALMASTDLARQARHLRAAAALVALEYNPRRVRDAIDWHAVCVALIRQEHASKTRAAQEIATVQAALAMVPDKGELKL